MSSSSLSTRSPGSMKKITRSPSSFRSLLGRRRKLDPRACIAEGHGLKIAVAGVETHFRVLIKDEDGDNVASDFTPEVSIMGSVDCKVHVTSIKEGIYDVRYASRQSGVFSVDVRVRDSQGVLWHVCGSPCRLVVEPAEPYCCHLLHSRNLSVRANEEVLISLALFDRFDNPVPFEGISQEDSASGLIRLAVFGDHKPLPKSRELRMSPLEMSRVCYGKSEIESDGGYSRLRAVDSFSVPIECESTLTARFPDIAQSNVFDVRVTISSAGTFMLRIMLGGLVLNEPTFIDVHPSSICPSSVFFQPGTLKQAGSPSCFYARLIDQHGNAVAVREPEEYFAMVVEEPQAYSDVDFSDASNESREHIGEARALRVQVSYLASLGILAVVFTPRAACRHTCYLLVRSSKGSNAQSAGDVIGGPLCFERSIESPIAHLRLTTNEVMSSPVVTLPKAQRLRSMVKANAALQLDFSAIEIKGDGDEGPRSSTAPHSLSLEAGGVPVSRPGESGAAVDGAAPAGLLGMSQDSRVEEGYMVSFPGAAGESVGEIHVSGEREEAVTKEGQESLAREHAESPVDTTEAPEADVSLKTSKESGKEADGQFAAMHLMLSPPAPKPAGELTSSPDDVAVTARHDDGEADVAGVDLEGMSAFLRAGFEAHRKNVTTGGGAWVEMKSASMVVSAGPPDAASSYFEGTVRAQAGQESHMRVVLKDLCGNAPIDREDFPCPSAELQMLGYATQAPIGEHVVIDGVRYGGRRQSSGQLLSAVMAPPQATAADPRGQGVWHLFFRPTVAGFVRITARLGDDVISTVPVIVPVEEHA